MQLAFFKLASGVCANPKTLPNIAAAALESQKKANFVKKRERFIFDRASDEGVVEGSGRGQRVKAIPVNKSIAERARARVPTAAGDYLALPT